MTYARLLVVLALLLPPLAAPSAETPANDEAKIRALMRGTWDRPEAPLALGPIVVSGTYALAGWVQGDLGGRALLQCKHGAWTVLFCCGDAFKDERTLTGLGVGGETARALAAALAAAEAKLDAQHVAKFSRFAGLVKWMSTDSIRRSTRRSTARRDTRPDGKPARPPCRVPAAHL